ncbi:O-methyltransferase [soil metagenome]
MSTDRSQQVVMDDMVLDYLLDHSTPLPSQAESAIERARELGLPSMHVSPDQAVLMRFLTRLMGARSVLEIGTFVGLSALVLAEAVGPDGRVLCLDRSDDWTSHARRLWTDAGVDDRVELRIGDAHDLVRGLGDSDVFDVVFIDADKSGYLDYLEEVTPRLRTGGLMMIDNTLWSGRVASDDDSSNDTEALRVFNAHLADDGRYDVAMTAVGDGLTLARKK